MDTGQFAEPPTEWSAVLNPSAGNQRFYMYMQTCTIMHSACVHVHMYYAAILVNHTKEVNGLEQFLAQGDGP